MPFGIRVVCYYTTLISASIGLPLFPASVTTSNKTATDFPGVVLFEIRNPNVVLSPSHVGHFVVVFGVENIGHVGLHGNARLSGSCVDGLLGYNFPAWTVGTESLPSNSAGWYVYSNRSWGVSGAVQDVFSWFNTDDVESQEVPSGGRSVEACVDPNNIRTSQWSIKPVNGLVKNGRYTLVEKVTNTITQVWIYPFVAR